MATTDQQLDIALDLFRAENYTAAIDELKPILQRPSPSADARHLLAQCEVLRDLKQALDAATKETYTGSINALIITLTDK